MFAPLRVAFALAVCVASSTAQVGWNGVWMFDEGTGTATLDISPFGNHGTLTNFAATQTAWLPGYNGAGSSVLFDGVDDYIGLANNGGIPIYRGDGAPFSICFWVKAPAQSAKRVYSEANGLAPTGGGALFNIGSGLANQGNDSKLMIYIRNDNGVWIRRNSATTVFDDTWHHVAYVDIAGIATLYVDGVPDPASFDYATANGGPQSANHGPYTMDTVAVGAVVRNTAVAFLQGQVDELRVFSFALSAAEVSNVFATGFPAQCSASIGEFGVGCAGSSFDLVAGGSAELGGVGLQLSAAGGIPGTVAVLVAELGPIAPMDLGFVGAPGCTLYPATANNLFLSGVLDAAGAITHPTVPIPANPALACQQANWQFLGLTIGSPLGIDVTDVAITTFGY